MPKKGSTGAASRTASALVSRYSQCATARLPGAARLATAAFALSLGLAAGGCSTSYQLGALFGKDGTKTEQTGSLVPQRVAATNAADAGAQGDLALAKKAAAEVLAAGAKDASLTWENPRTGARGTVTPLASAYPQDGTVCHDFLASYVRGDRESWYQGGACRYGSKWEVRDIRPLQRT